MRDHTGERRADDGTLQTRLRYAYLRLSALDIGDGGFATSLPGTRIGIDVIGALRADKALLDQFSRYPKAMAFTAVLMFGIAVAPAVPFTPFAFMAALFGGLSYMSWKRQEVEKERPILTGGQHRQFAARLRIDGGMNLFEIRRLAAQGRPVIDQLEGDFLPRKVDERHCGTSVLVFRHRR